MTKHQTKKTFTIKMRADRRLKTFSPFPKLAIELQYAIWKYAVEVLPRRIIEVKLVDQGENTKVVSKTLAPSLLHVCGTSRKFALEKYVPLTFDDQFSGTHIYWKKDALAFDPEYGFMSHLSKSLTAGPNYSHLFDFSTSIVLHSMLKLFSLSSLEEFLGRFKNLSSVYIIVDEPRDGDGNLVFNFYDEEHRNKIQYKCASEDAGKNFTVEIEHVDVFRGGEKRLKGRRKQEKWDRYLEARKAAAGALENVCQAGEENNR